MDDHRDDTGRRGEAGGSFFTDPFVWGLRIASAPILLAAILVWAILVAAGATIHVLIRGFARIGEWMRRSRSLLALTMTGLSR